MLAWTQQNTMQRAMWTVLEWPQSHAISKTINMLTNKSEPQQKCRLGTVSKILLGGLNRFYRRLTSIMQLGPGIWIFWSSRHM